MQSLKTQDIPENLIVESGFGFTALLLARGSSSSESEIVRSTTLFSLISLLTSGGLSFIQFELAVDESAVTTALKIKLEEYQFKFYI